MIKGNQKAKIDPAVALLRAERERRAAEGRQVPVGSSGGRDTGGIVYDGVHDYAERHRAVWEAQ